MTSEPIAKKFSVSKLDAAKRQLDTAIRLWFHDGDEVSIHTLVGASYQIIHDINEKRGRKDFLFDGAFIKDEHRKTVVDFLRKDFMFFKHADKNTDGITEFVPLGSLLFMLAGMQMLRDLGESASDVQIVFGIYLALTQPECISASYVAALLASSTPENAALVRRMSKKEFFEASLQARGILRAQGRIP